MTYSTLAVVAVVAVLVVDLAVYRTRMVTRRVFWAAYAIIVVFQLLMNGVLTGLGVVVYDPDAIWGPRIAYAPVEDLLFGFAMVTLTLASWAAVNRRANTARRRGLDTDDPAVEHPVVGPLDLAEDAAVQGGRRPDAVPGLRREQPACRVRRRRSGGGRRRPSPASAPRSARRAASRPAAPG